MFKYIPLASGVVLSGCGSKDDSSSSSDCSYEAGKTKMTFTVANKKVTVTSMSCSGTAVEKDTLVEIAGDTNVFGEPADCPALKTKLGTTDLCDTTFKVPLPKIEQWTKFTGFMTGKPTDKTAGIVGSCKFIETDTKSVETSAEFNTALVAAMNAKDDDPVKTSLKTSDPCDIIPFYTISMGTGKSFAYTLKPAATAGAAGTFVLSKLTCMSGTTSVTPASDLVGMLLADTAVLSDTNKSSDAELAKRVGSASPAIDLCATSFYLTGLVATNFKNINGKYTNIVEKNVRFDATVGTNTSTCQVNGAPVSVSSGFTGLLSGTRWNGLATITAINAELAKTDGEVCATFANDTCTAVPTVVSSSNIVVGAAAGKTITATLAGDGTPTVTAVSATFCSNGLADADVVASANAQLQGKFSAYKMTANTCGASSVNLTSFLSNATGINSLLDPCARYCPAALTVNVPAQTGTASYAKVNFYIDSSKKLKVWKVQCMVSTGGVYGATGTPVALSTINTTNLDQTALAAMTTKDCAASGTTQVLTADFKKSDGSTAADYATFCA